MATAKGRMIDRSISTSRKLSKVSDRSALIFSWTIPHTDDFGRMDGDARMIRAVVVPLRDYTVEQIEESLKELEDVGLIERYTIKEDIYLQVTNFDTYQKFRSDRDRVGQFPDPRGKIPRGDTTGIPVVHQTETKGEPVVENSPRSKVKESKVKESKIKKEVVPVGDAYGEFDNVFLTAENYDRLLNHWLGGNQQALDELIFELSTYMQQSEKNRKKYTDHYATLLTWAKKKFGEAKIKANAKKKDIVGLDE